jgi:phosphonate transport system permease protein
MIAAASARPLITQIRRRAMLAIGLPILVLAYLAYAAIALDVAGVAQRMRWDNAQILLSDFVSYKVHVTRPTGGTVVATIDGNARDTFPQLPDWISQQGDGTRIDLGNGHVVTYFAEGARYDVPGYGSVTVIAEGGALRLDAPEPLPDWISAARNRVEVKTSAGRFIATRSKVETFRYFWGWESFFFTLDSAFWGRGPGELAALALWQPRLDPSLSNLAAMGRDFWNNRLWHHGQVVGAMGETVLMAFLGTMAAALVALPLAFLSARNLMPVWPLRFGLRRVFDFIRGTDALIWTLILSRAFGPGPMTGALAILITDTGLFGKTFAEALENIDDKQVEGIRSTGANATQRARFGILPQVAPVLLSQVLYALESNTRSATVIGALVGGGIGLLLTQAIQTQKDWEDVAYYLVLVVLTVMAMDSLSGWLRRKLIKGE